MFPARDPGKPELQIIGEEDRVNATQQERRRPIPPSCQKAPKVAERGTHPTIEATLDGHCRGQFSRNERYRNAPEERQDEVIKQRHAGTRRGDLVLEAEGASRRIGIHHEDEVEESCFLRRRFRERSPGSAER